MLWVECVVEAICFYVECCCFFFFFKQKTAYEMLRSLVGSEMCIRDRLAVDYERATLVPSDDAVSNDQMLGPSFRGPDSDLSLIHI